MKTQEINSLGSLDHPLCDNCKSRKTCLVVRQTGVNKACKDCPGCALCVYWVLRQVEPLENSYIMAHKKIRKD